MTVRRASPEDAPAIAAISVRAWRKAYGHILPAEKLATLDIDARAVRWEGRLTKTPPEDVWVVLDGERTVGFAAGCLKVDEPFQNEWFITAVYVDPDLQGRGAGRLVLRAAVGHGMALGQPDVKLSVFQENHSARQFYAKCGGEETDQGTWDWEGETYPIVYVRFNRTP